MFNFTKKPPNDSAAYNAAIKKIEWLEGELSQKTYELDQSCKAQQKMSEGVRDCIASLFSVQSQLQIVVTHLERSNHQILKLMKKNETLKSSGDQWFRRAIKLEFEVLTAQDGLKKIENERDMAVQTIERLRSQLVSPDKENSRGGN